MGDTRHCWGAFGPHLIPGALLTLGGLGDAWAFWGLSLTATLVCISAAILGRREQSFNEHLLCVIHHFTVPAVACEAGTWQGPLVGHLLGQIQTRIHLTSGHWPFPLCPPVAHPQAPGLAPLTCLVAAVSTANSEDCFLCSRCPSRTSPALSTGLVPSALHSRFGRWQPQITDEETKVKCPVQGHPLRRANHDANFHSPDTP